MFIKDRCEKCEEPYTPKMGYKFNCSCERKEERSYSKVKRVRRFVSLEEYNRQRNFRRGYPN